MADELYYIILMNLLIFFNLTIDFRTFDHLHSIENTKCYFFLHIFNQAKLRKYSRKKLDSYKLLNLSLKIFGLYLIIISHIYPRSPAQIVKAPHLVVQYEGSSKTLGSIGPTL